jgi:hypothetical protein
MTDDLDWLIKQYAPVLQNNDCWELERQADLVEVEPDADDPPRAVARVCRDKPCRRARTCQKGKACKNEKMRWHLRDIAYEAEMAAEAAAAAAAERKAARQHSQSRRKSPENAPE